MLKVGDSAPLFELADQNGDLHKLEDYKGQWVVLYLYPKDMTPGCTTEACSFRDNYSAFEKMNVKVFGLSFDSVKRHAKFVEKESLPFTLLSDEEHKVIDAYGAWQLKKFMGREYMGTMRWTFIIDPEGKIAKIYDKVKVKVHVDEILEDIEHIIGN